MRKYFFVFMLLISGLANSAEIKTSKGDFFKVPNDYLRSVSGLSWGDKSPVLSLKFDSSIIGVDDHYGYIRGMIFYDKDYDTLKGGECSSINAVMKRSEHRKEGGVNYFYEELGGDELYYFSSAYASLDGNYHCDRTKDFFAKYQPAKDFVAGSIVRKGVSACRLLFNHRSVAISISYNGKDCRYEKYAETVESFRVLMDSWKLHKE